MYRYKYSYLGQIQRSNYEKHCSDKENQLNLWAIFIILRLIVIPNVAHKHNLRFSLAFLTQNKFEKYLKKKKKKAVEENVIQLSTDAPLN